MFSNEIKFIMKNVPNFYGVYSRDNLPQPERYPFSLITNTDLKTETGTHWIAVYVDDKGKGVYFDSYAQAPQHEEFIDFLNINCPGGYTWNKKPLQCLTCVTCGEYCCVYIALRTAGINHKQFVDTFIQDPSKNDIIIKELFRILQ